MSVDAGMTNASLHAIACSGGFHHARIDTHTRAHRGGNRDALQVATFGGGWLGALQFVKHRAHVGHEGVDTEARLADRHVHLAA